uniref:Secreted protein n=1 Tax=Pavo cristatus TaxID=9049 RepID=A0A8C9FUG8_PAVCR
MQIHCFLLLSCFAFAFQTVPHLHQMYLRVFRKIFCGPWMTFSLFFSMWCYEPGRLFLAQYIMYHVFFTCPLLSPLM